MTAKRFHQWLIKSLSSLHHSESLALFDKRFRNSQPQHLNDRSVHAPAGCNLVFHPQGVVLLHILKPSFSLFDAAGPSFLAALARTLLLHVCLSVCLCAHLQYGVKEITLTGQKVHFLTKTSNTLNMTLYVFFFQLVSGGLYFSSCGTERFV